MNLINKIKTILIEKHILDFIKRYLYIIPFGLSFLLLDIYLRYINTSRIYYGVKTLSPNLFTLAWVSFFTAIFVLLKSKHKKVFYYILISISIILTLVNYIFFNIFHTFFSFKTMSMTGEGTDYFNVAFTYIKWPIVLLILSCIILVILSTKLIPKDNIKNDKMIAIFLVAVAITSYIGARIKLGEPIDKLMGGGWNYMRNVYDDYDEPRNSLQVSGFYEYTIRDLKLSFFVIKKINPEDIAYLDSYFANDLKTVSDNKYKGMFKNKNLILILMESIDDWIVTEQTMPTLYNMMNSGINFTNHFSPIYGGGATFNTEFMINTGYMTPFNGGSAAYYYNSNIFPESLPNLFKKNEYKNVNQFHLNYGTFYNRSQMAKVFGYNNYYSSYEMGYSIEESVDDSHFMEIEKIRNLILPNEKFMSFIITYSAHVSYSINGIECQTAIPDEKERKKAALKDEEKNCVTAQSKLTDNFFKLLLENLEKQNILDDTIIVGVTDHYTYGLTDKEQLYDLKNTHDDNLIHKTPFFIWGNNIESLEVTEVNTNLDIVPTLAYLFGLDYNPNYYLGNNILDENYDGFAFFADYSWYDNNVYYKNNKIVQGDTVSKEYINNRNKQIAEILDVNKKVLETNYFNTLNNE